MTTWNKPWPPEIDWLYSYVNLSTYHPIVLEALAVGCRITKHSKYFSSSEWGCILQFPMDPELGDEYYMNHYADTNNTMYICTPYIPVRLDRPKKYVQTHPHMYSMIGCYIYQLGFLKRLYERSHWSYYFSSHFPLDDRLFMVAAVLVVITGIFGEYC